MILEQGRIIEFDRYAELSVNEEKLTLLCAQACHLVEKLNLRILFVVQSNGKRRICNVERNGRSLDSSPNPFIRVSMSLPVLQYPIFPHVITQKPSMRRSQLRPLPRYYLRLHNKRFLYQTICVLEVPSSFRFSRLSLAARCAMKVVRNK